MSRPEINIIIAGGGTGGHLFPGISIAQEFLRKNPDNRILFTGTDRPFELKALKRAGFNHKNIRIGGLKGLGILKKLKTLIMLPFAVFQSICIIRSFGANLIIGVGGYSSGPVVIAGRLMRKKIVLHEQNIIPGITNRTLSGFANRIYISFSESANHFSMTEIITTGDPVREEILNVTPGSAGDPEIFTVFVSGGSQGAHAVNMAVIDSLTYLKPEQKIAFIHQTGETDFETVKKAYSEKGIDALVQPFFNDMNIQYAKADLLICRAGATTIAEITAMGHSSILIPFPYAADNHQVKNAMTLEEKNAAKMITEDILDGKVLGDIISFYSENPAELKEMSKNSKKYGRPDAAAAIVNDCYELIKG